MTDDSNPHMFLMFFLALAGCSLVSLPVTLWVSDSRRGLTQLTLASMPVNVRAEAEKLNDQAIIA